MLILIVATGPQKGRIYDLLDGQALVLGRQGDQIRLTDSRVSRHHAKLTADGDQWYIQDLGSMHGTLLNRELIAGPAALSDGDQIRIGRTVMVLARMSLEDAERAALLDGAASADSSIDRLPGRRRLNKKKVFAVAACFVLLVGAELGLLAWVSPAGTIGRAGVSLARGVSSMYDSVVGKPSGGAAPAHTASPAFTVASTAPIDQSTSLASANQGQSLPGTDAADAAREKAREKEMAKLAALTAALNKQQATSEKMSEQIRAATVAADASAKALAQLRQSLAGKSAAKELAALGGKLDAALGEIKKQSETQASLTELRKTLEQDSRSSQLDDLTRKLDATLAQMKQQQQSQASVAALQQAIEAHWGDDHLAALSGKLDTALAELKRQKSIEQSIAELRAAIQSDTSDKRLAALSAKLDQAISKMQQPTDNQKVLDAIAALKKQLPASTSAQLQKVLARLDHQPTKQQLIDAVRQALANDVARPAALATETADASGDQAQPVPSGIATSGDAVVGSPGAESKTQLAYQRAFETGRKIRIGQHVDPKTGKKSGGRVLDPRAARLAGITSWQQWYTLDDLAQRLAMRQKAAAYAEHRPATVIQIPDIAGDDSNAPDTQKSR